MPKHRSVRRPTRKYTARKNREALLQNLAPTDFSRQRVNPAGNENDAPRGSAAPLISTRTTRAGAAAQEIAALNDGIEAGRRELAAAREAGAAERIEHAATRSALADVQNKLASSENTRASMQQRLRAVHQIYRNERRKVERAKRARRDFAGRIQDLELVQLPAASTKLYETEQHLQSARLDSRAQQALIDKLMEDAVSTASFYKRQAIVNKQSMKKYKIKCEHIPERIAKAVARSKRQSHAVAQTFRLTHKGGYTPCVRSLARKLVKAGCSQEHVGPTIASIASMLGISVKGRISRRTVGRALREGGIASKIQLGHEVKNADSFTVSTDGTSHKSLQYESRHIALKAKSYAPGTPHSESPSQRVRLMSVRTSVNHTSESQLAGLKEDLESIRTAYNESPLARREAITLEAEEIVAKFSGMNTDHAEDQKKLFRLACLWKAECMQAELGRRELIARPTEELLVLLLDTNRRKIEEAGGDEAWEALSPEAQTVLEVNAMKDLSVRLGKEAYADLPEKRKRELDLFIWCGCCMHKELNSVKGGNRAMQEWWIANSIVGPMLLANRDNAATLDGASSSGYTTAAEKRAFDISSRGGVKLTQLLGALMNHKDDKKGYQDLYRIHVRELYGCLSKFPDTNNTRYQSHCDAAMEALVYILGIIRLLETERDKKANRKLNHMEQNIYDALHDLATLTELVALALYALAITYPYMRCVRGLEGRGANMLDLGPLHVLVKNHCQKIIDNPDLLLSPDADFETATMDGHDWARSDVMVAIHELSPRLPHVRPITVAFFTGALATWERFTSEFAPGGLIDEATADERQRAWMPATNDANEGALGSFRLHARMKPNTTIHAYGAQATFNHNDTDAFMDAHFTEDEDHQHIRRKAREEDASGLAAQQRKAQHEYDEKIVADKRAKDAVKAQKVAEKRAHLSTLSLHLDPSTVASLSNVQLDEQLEKHRDLGNPDVPKKKDARLKAAKVSGLLAAIARHSQQMDVDVADGDLEDIDPEGVAREDAMFSPEIVMELGDTALDTEYDT